jgi:G:T-mismatch repair DNA endonuclease (very short patch repair protein)
MIRCKCGCGKEVYGFNNMLNKPHEFILGHNMRLMGYLKKVEKKCLNCKKIFIIQKHESKKFCCKKCYWMYMIGKTNGSKGFKHSEEYKKNVSKRSLIMWKSKNFINKRFNLMHKYSDKDILILWNRGLVIKGISKETNVSEKTICRILKENGITKEDIKYRKGKILSKLRKDDFSKGKFIFPVKDTSIEVKIQNFLKQLNIEFLTHQYIKDIEHGYQCDILIPVQEGINKKTIIECFGNYWHKYPLSREIDIQRCNELREQGWRVLVFWENEIILMNIENINKYIKYNKLVL